MLNEILTGVVSNLTEVYTVTLGANLFTKAGNLIAGIAPAFSAGFGLYMLLVAINAYGRGLDENILDIAKRAVGWLVIIGFAFNAGNYAHLANIIYGLPEELAGLLGANLSDSAFTTAANELQRTLDAIWAMDTSLFMGMGTDFGSAIGKAIIWVVVLFCGFILIGICMAFYFLAKVSLAMTLLVGPLFLGMMLFPGTRQYGTNWINQCGGYVISIVLYVALISVIFNQFTTTVQRYQSIGSLPEALLLPPVFLLMTLIAMAVVWNVPNIAQTLTGGAGISGWGGGMRSMMPVIRGAGSRPVTWVASGFRAGYNRWFGNKISSK